MTAPTPLGERVAQARHDAGFKSIRAAARAAGVDEAVWRRLESGRAAVARGIVTPYRPSDATLRAVASVLAVDVAELLALRGEDDRPDAPERIDDRVTELEAKAERTEEAIRRLRRDVGRLLRSVGLDP